MSEEEQVRVECINEFVDLEADTRREPAKPFHPEPDRWYTSPERAEGLVRGNFVQIIDEDGNPIGSKYPWGEPLESRFLTTAELEYGYWNRVVACLNVWNDRPALEETWDTWYPYVNKVIAVDGVYSGGTVTEPSSTDGTLEFLRGYEKVEIISAPEDRMWSDQIEKRNQYFQRLEDRDLAFIVDADEYVENAEILSDLPRFDIGWVPYKKDIYYKEQNFPRLYNGGLDWEYSNRHYWIEGEHGFATDGQIGGSGYDHMFVPLYIDNTHRNDLRSEERQKNDRIIRASQFVREAGVSDKQQGGRESLRIVQLTSLDPGMVVFRFHTALNSTTPHESAMASSRKPRNFEEPYQWYLKEDRRKIRGALRECDVIHCHLSYQEFDSLGVRTGNTPVVIHHHGTTYRREPEKVNKRDERKADVRFVSNPELMQYDDDLHYLPNPVPVRRYKRMRERLYTPDPDGYFRVGHSPSKRWLKGTEEFLEAIEALQNKGVKIKPVLIEGETHENSIRMKAERCEAFFDSFWLGAIQCSGLEAGAMGMPVLGGDEDVQNWFLETRGEVPYIRTSPDSVKSKLEQLVESWRADRSYYIGMAGRFYDYIVENHDYPAVTKEYLDVLDEQLNWRKKLTLGNDRFLKV